MIRHGAIHLLDLDEAIFQNNMHLYKIKDLN